MKQCMCQHNKALIWETRRGKIEMKIFIVFVWSWISAHRKHTIADMDPDIQTVLFFNCHGFETRLYNLWSLPSSNWSSTCWYCYNSSLKVWQYTNYHTYSCRLLHWWSSTSNISKVKGEIHLMIKNVCLDQSTLNPYYITVWNDLTCLNYMIQTWIFFVMKWMPKLHPLVWLKT